MNKFDQKWEENFALFREFLALYKRLPAGKETYCDFNLGDWFTNQLRAGHAGVLPEHKARLLADACHVKDPDALLYFDRQDLNRCILMGTWKDRLPPDEISIDTAISGDFLEDCLRRGIYSCRDYINEMEVLCAKRDKRDKISYFSYPNEPYLFCRHNAETVFHTQFPELDFSCFSLYICVYTPNNSNLFKEDELEALGHKPTLFEAAEAMSAYSRFGSRAEMRQAYAELIATLPPQQQIILRARYFQHQTFGAISESLCLTTQRIQQVHTRAMRKLQHPSLKKQVAPIHPRDLAAENARKAQRMAAEKAEDLALNNAMEALNKEIDEYLAVSRLPITDVLWSTRVFNCLCRNNIETLGQLASLTRDELLQMRPIGLKSVQEVESKLEKYGLSLSPNREGQVSKTSRTFSSSDLSPLTEPSPSVRKIEDDFSSDLYATDCEVNIVSRHPSLDEQLFNAQSRRKPSSGDDFNSIFGATKSGREPADPEEEIYGEGELVTLSGTEYVLLEVSDNSVVLQDAQHPLFTNELPIEVFRTLMATSAANSKRDLPCDVVSGTPQETAAIQTKRHEPGR